MQLTQPGFLIPNEAGAKRFGVRGFIAASSVSAGNQFPAAKARMNSRTPKGQPGPVIQTS